MTNLIPEYWDIDGTSMHTLGTHLSNLGGDFTGGADLRGENLSVPYRPGAFWVEKTPGQRTLTLAVNVTDAKPDGSFEATETLRKARFNANLRAVRRLLWRDNGGQFSLTKRWYEADFSAGTPVATLVSATALAEFSDGIEPEGDDAFSCMFTVDLLLADPYFYGPTVTVTAAAGASASCVNPGDARAVGNNAVLTFVGPLANPVVDLDGRTLGIGASIATGDSVVVDLAAWSVLRTSDGANLIGTLTRSGSRALLPIPIGASTLTVSASGAGSIELTFKPPYL